MSRFWYQAVNATGETEEGEIEAAAEAAAVARLQDAGYVPIRIRAAGGSKRGTRRSRSTALQFRLSRRGIGAGDIANFTRELATMLGAGLPLDHSLQTLTEVSDNDKLKEITATIYEKVRGGETFSSALGSLDGVFSDLYIQMVKAGEAGGALDSTLARLADHLARSKKLRESVISALTYPLVLVAVAGISIVVLLSFVIPQFSQMFEDMGTALPLPTRIVIGVSEWLRHYWWTIPLAIVLIAMVFRRWRAVPANRVRWDRWMLRQPLVGDFMVKIDLARFTHTLGVTLGNGVPLLQAMEIAARGMQNRALGAVVTDAAEQVQQGRTLASALEQNEQLPKLAIKMIRVGEESGQLEKMLLQLADMYDQETQLAVQRLLSLLEPVLIVGLGVLIAGIIMSVLVAVLGMNQLVF